MSRDLCDETFPANLLIEFDELDDEIPISPELPKRHQQPESFTEHHRHLTSATKRIISDKNNVDDRNGSRMVISGSSNTSSGHSSLSTEGENRSSSASDRDTSRDLSKRLPSRPSDVGGPVPALLLLGEQRNTDKLTLKARKIRQPRSMESLLQSKDQRLKLAATPLGKGIGGGSTGNVSVASVGTTFQQQHYQRHRSKYGHVQSKVKQMIEEMKPPPASGRDRKTLVRHKSMPETSYDADSKDEEEEAIEQENDVETLRSVVRELRLHMSSLEQQLTLCRTSVFNELAALQSKNSALRLENDHLLEQERAREQRRQLLREQQTTAGSCYGSQSSLYKVQPPGQPTCTIATQTSPTDDLLFEFLLASPPTSSHPAPGAALSSGDCEPDGDFSPDYEQLLPSLAGSPAAGGRPELRRRTPSVRSPPGGGRFETGQQAEECAACHDCRRRRKKRKSRKQKLASLFCIRQHDESL
uniref:uncharacterized protein LOC120958301 n=1 Tax=Anopheles coluzzii TaxID=1518534 RepID=UPI0020FFD407|nr:uncharacterized protein LOC120958301 [Anopheles coluzzii]